VAGSEPVVIWSPGFTVTERFCGVLADPAASVTVTENGNCVAVVSGGAVPERAPVDDSVSQDGNPVLCQVNGEVPPVSARFWLYTWPDVVDGSEVVVTDGGALTVNVKALVDEAETLSVTFKVKLTGPADGGVPLNSPPPVMVNQEGSVVPLSAKVSVPAPPDAVMVCEYGRLAVHGGSGEAVVMAGSGLTTTV